MSRMFGFRRWFQGITSRQRSHSFEQGSGRSSFCRIEWPEMIDFITKRCVRIIMKNGIFST